jgi:hypothetical protein
MYPPNDDETVDKETPKRKRGGDQGGLSEHAFDKTKTTNFVQQHLGGRADRDKGNPDFVITEPHDRRFGVSVSEQNPDAEGFKKAYREHTIRYREDSGGSGLDENVSTSTTAKIRDLLHEEGLASEDIHKIVGKFSEARDHVGELMWTDGDNTEQPLNAHPGGLSKIQSDMRRGIASQHNTRDSERAKWVMKEFKDNFSDNVPMSDVIKNTKLIANVETIREMSEPFSKLSDVDASEAIDAYHPKFGPIVKEGELTSAFEHAAAAAHNNRELKKVRAADGLIKQGFGNLVPPKMTELLAEHGNDADAAHHSRYVEQDRNVKDTGLPETQTTLPEVPQTLREMSEANKRTPGMNRAISDPRKLIKPQLKTNVEKPKSYRQALLEESRFNAAPQSNENIREEGKHVTKKVKM